MEEAAAKRVQNLTTICETLRFDGRTVTVYDLRKEREKRALPILEMRGDMRPIPRGLPGFHFFVRDFDVPRI